MTPEVGNSPVVFDVRGVSYIYEGKQMALKNVDLSICSGESLVILGANGCGKSTLLKLLDGLYYPNEGSIYAFGKPLTEEALRSDEYNFAFRRRVGLVFQDPDVQLFSPSVVDEVAFAPLQLGFPRAEVERRIDWALAALQIEKLRDRAPHRLSGGEKRRVALASLLTLEPDIWLMDEPTTGLDPRSQSWLVEFIVEQRKLGKTMITATHDLSIADEIASRICVFSEDHRIVASGEPSDVLNDHDLLHQCNLAHYHARATV
ncbi:MAG TPA: ABC transporter ATP-binding protein [Anaerolineales bacterium]|nr:ABC transporter ATP-binding protein [Anaerolineales bacterium]